MKHAQGIRNFIRNIEYYCNQISQEAIAQFNEDMEIGKQMGIHEVSGVVRFECLGAIPNACHQIRLQLRNIESNLNSAEDQDKKFTAPNEEEESAEIAAKESESIQEEKEKEDVKTFAEKEQQGLLEPDDIPY